MTTPVWVLLGFAAWTLLILICTIGGYRWYHILTGRAEHIDFRAVAPTGPDWYKRSIRAHANCLENLPIYTAIVVAIIATHIESETLNKLAITIMIFRILQSLTHILFKQTPNVMGLRFLFFFTQLISMIWMGLYIALNQ